MNFIISKLANYVLILDKLQNGMSDPSHVPDVQATYHSIDGLLTTAMALRKAG